MDIENILKENKKSITKERKEIFEYIKTKHVFSSADILLAFQDIGRASIFRTIKLFSEIGIIRRVNIGERGDYYEIEHSHSHHEHMKCSNCGNIISFGSEDICKKIFEKAKKIGFQIHEHSVSLIGTCKKCQCL